MPDKPLTIATYAAGASLAAITLVYVFGPTFFLDDDAANSARKKGVVGLANPANDCFINSVLQALAGLPHLRLYLIRETHRRNLDGPDVYRVPPSDHPDELAPAKRDAAAQKLDGLQQGLVTLALKDVLDKLNERPIYRKTISAQGFVGALEHAFRSRISRQQQDAQEFLQVVTERVWQEYTAGQAARKKARRRRSHGTTAEKDREELLQEVTNGDGESDHDDHDEHEEGFPFEGQLESQIECLTCHFKPKPTASSFVTMTLNVPEAYSTTLNSCFDGILKIEYIDDFRCEYCRLEHALHYKQAELEKATTEKERMELDSDISKIKHAMETDPETPPKDVTLPDSKLAPTRRISRHMRISKFPKILAIHLSRSVFTAGNYGNYSTKNMAKVAFPEVLPLGGLIERKKYNLLGVVTHKGGHNSGHYESFRRQVTLAPYSTPHSFGTEGVYSLSGSPNPSAMQSPRPSACRDRSELRTPDSTHLPSPALASTSAASLSSKSSLSSMQHRPPPPTSAPSSSVREEDSIKKAPSTPSHSASPSRLRAVGEKAASKAELVVDAVKRKPKRRDNRWWRISDDKIKESKTNDVLGMQREVYMLFYELDRSEE
ncbi:hypothetical protein HDK77DRAFT_152074 [Phyllosticta capitalensis]|uniref:Ubiquitin carboxyl-terminal hydrolase n=1 Tax=Phyllosticta capitalensis TaxID=121624 RepID=A0ABR1YTS3_9PEZI